MLSFIGWIFLMWLLLTSVEVFGRVLSETEWFTAHMERKLERAAKTQEDKQDG